MVIIKTMLCPNCKNGIKVSVRQLPKGMYEVLFFDSRDKNARVRIAECPSCKTPLFQPEMIKTMTGLDLAKLNR
jgi:hypothetical protein